MRLALLYLFLLGGIAFAQTPPPDCQINLPTLTTAGTYNSVVFDNRSVVCVTWYLQWQTNGNMTVTFQAATTAGTPADGDFQTFPGVTVVGTNPTQGVSGFSAFVNGAVAIPWVRVHLVLNSGTLANGLLYGYKAGNSGGLVSCGNAPQAQPYCQVGGINLPSTISLTTFTGTGRNDAQFDGSYSIAAQYLNTASTAFCAKIDGNGTPDTFRWGTNSPACNNGATAVPIVAGLTPPGNPLSNGIFLIFTQTTGHNIGDMWSATATLNPAANPIATGAVGSTQLGNTYSGSYNVLFDHACDQQAAISISGSGSTLIVTGTANLKIHVCGVFLSNSAVSNITFVSGTGSTCGTGSTNLTGALQSVLTAVLGFGQRSYLVTANFGDSLCLNYASSVTGGGFVNFSTY